MCNETSALLISYDCTTGTFVCLSGESALDALWQTLAHGGEGTQNLRDQAAALAARQLPQARTVRLAIGGQPCQATLIAVPGTAVTIALTPENAQSMDSLLYQDQLTGLSGQEVFCQAVDQRLQADPEGKNRGKYAIIYIDFLRFKVINDLFGREKGDDLLVHIADALRCCQKCGGLCSRIVSDHFVVLLPLKDHQPEELLQNLSASLKDFDLPIEITFHAGIYITTEHPLSVDAMIDRAALALSTIKGNYNTRCAYYSSDMRQALLSEQETVGMMATALEEKQFVIYYQPQYNHSTGMLVGAEALVRWMHPEKGLISPGDFIPIFEKNGLITNLDLYVFEEACIFLRKSMDNRWSIVPISANFSQYDIFQPGFVQQLEQIRSRYAVPAKYLRVELTESVMVGGAEYVNQVIKELHYYGYIVEMDDFGSGYSSLNVLKDVDLDIIKLDMRFLSKSSNNDKGGTILSSIVRMAKWLRLPVIAEGVETVEQADFLRSIGCEYIQGYLYSRPLPEENYTALISATRIGATVPQMQLIDTMNAYNFWDPDSQETLIFSNYVGAAAIFDYQDGKLEILRVNKKYLRELGMNLSERDLIESDLLSTIEPESRPVYQAMLQKAIDTMEEQECETWQRIASDCCGDERFCIRTSVQVIGVTGDRYLFHAMIRNITAERLYYDSLQDNDRRVRAMMEQTQVYYWEYNIATKEMRPCFRCMRDLGLPPVLTNYPESAIESNVWPPEEADSYREFMRKIDEGVPSLEAIYPLTLNRIPFHVRYTTEFDENGHAVKAYGSATLVVD